LTKTELIGVAAAKAGLPRAAAEKLINAAIETVTEVLGKGNKVTIVGFGTFEAVKRQERQGVNPRTGKPIKIKASKAPRFRAGKTLKEAVNSKK
jgi:DNA-binding protein HU-beta